MPLTQLGPTRRKQFGTFDFAYYQMRGGLNVKSTPQEVGDEDLTIAMNGYLRSDGGFQTRNGMKLFGTPPAVGSLVLARFYQDVVNGTAETTEITATLGQIGNTLYQINSGSNTTLGSIGTGSPNAGPMTWTRIQQAASQYYTGLTDCMVICTGSGGPYVWNGTNLYTPAGWASAAGASYCEVVNGILWFGGIKSQPQALYGSGDGITANFETLPSYRFFSMSAPITGLRAIGTGANAILSVGRNTGLSLLYGTGPSTFYLQDVPFPDGVAAGRTMVSGSGVLYFLGRMAYYSFDGVSTPERASDKIEPWILNDPIAAATGYPMTGNFNLSWATIYNNRIHLGYCTGGSSTPSAVLCLDLVVNGWTVLIPSPGLASMILYDAPSDPAPYMCYVGSSTTGQAYQWDYVPAFVNGVAQPALDGAVPVLAQAQSKYFKIGVPGTNKVLKRLYPEFFVSAVPFAVPFVASTDYGNSSTSVVVENAPSTAGLLIWDVGAWDVNYWGGSGGFTSFNAPASRIDFDVPFEALAVGFSMTAATAPFIWAGGTGTCSQRGRT